MRKFFYRLLLIALVSWSQTVSAQDTKRYTGVATKLVGLINSAD